MRADEIPDALRALLDERAGRVHSESGAVASALAEILTRHEAMVRTAVADELAVKAAQLRAAYPQPGEAFRPIEYVNGWEDAADAAYPPE